LRERKLRDAKGKNRKPERQNRKPRSQCRRPALRQSPGSCATCPAGRTALCPEMSVAPATVHNFSPAEFGDREANPWMLSARMDPAHLAAGRSCEKSHQGHVPYPGRCDGDRSLADGRWKTADSNQRTARWSDRDSNLRSKKALGGKDPLDSRYSSRRPSTP
jgi:hypothetical protein